MAKKKIVTIIILNYNGKLDTLECLESLTKLVSDALEIRILVVDNASSDDSVRSIKKKFPKVKLVANRENLGFCEGNNIGAAEAFRSGSDYALILNNDTFVDPDLVEKLVANLEAEKADIASPKIFFAPGFEFHRGKYEDAQRGKVIWYAGGEIDWANVLPHHRGVDEVDHGQYDKPEKTSFVTGCATLLNKKAYEAVGLYDPVYMFYFEDADFSLRAASNGLKVLYLPMAKLWHKNASSFGGSGSPFQDYFVSRNRLIFGLRYAPLRSKLALLKESLRFLLKGPPLRRRAIADALLRRTADLQTLR